MLNNKAVIAYLVEFHATRDYFECHEIMEEFWKDTPKDKYEPLWVALIQVAVAQYHHRRQNLRGAQRMYTSALEKLQLFVTEVSEIDINKLGLDISTKLATIEQPFIDINIDIKNIELKAACLQLTTDRGLKWAILSSKVGDDIIHRHKVRDRSEVVAERHRALELKRKKRVDN